MTFPENRAALRTYFINELLSLKKSLLIYLIFPPAIKVNPIIFQRQMAKDESLYLSPEP